MSGEHHGHHAVLGGLLQHTCEVATIGRSVAEACGADPDLVLAGALLHDIGKLEAYRWRAGFETTEAGALLGHVALGLMMLRRRVAERPPPACTDAELLLLLHLIASHHGRLKFGAACPPMTLEAEVLHYADDARRRRRERQGPPAAAMPCCPPEGYGSWTGGGSIGAAATGVAEGPAGTPGWKKRTAA